MEFNIFRMHIFLAIVIVNLNNNAVAQNDTQTTPTATAQSHLNDSITINGTILDSITGEFPHNDSFVVKIDSANVLCDTDGNFGLQLSGLTYHTINISSKNFVHFSRIIPVIPDKKNYFITCALHLTNNNPVIPDAQKKENIISSGPCWTISGCIVDSKHDLAIKSDSFSVTFNDSIIKISEKGGFFVSTCKGGIHTFYVKVPGYHEAIEQVELKTGEMQPFITIPTTKLQNKISRREITVIAKKEPVHITSTVSKTQISRTELTRTASTLNDPARVVQTLPGVASQSDASARPIVRGGEPRETRVFYDNVPLIQPYHFGGGRSMFNELGVQNISLYKSGFPAEYSNATSALLTVNGRKPLDEPFALGLNCNLLQTDAYMGIPLYKNKVGINASFQSSYYDFIYKRALDLVSLITNGSVSDLSIEQMKEDITMPDYLDFSAGLEFRPTDKLHIFINEIHNTDKYKYIERKAYGEEGINAERDTFIDYASNYNVLYGTAKYLPAPEHIINITGAWQKRGWDLIFPAPFSVFADTSIYNVKLSQYNFNLNWLYSGFSDHIVNAGFQIDYNRANYDVNVARIIQQVILNGSSNFTDFWGPLTQDNGLTLVSNQFNAFNTTDMVKHIFVKYKGNSSWFNGGLFLQDEWNLTPRLTLDLGVRLEMCRADSSITISPRVSGKYSLAPNHELIGAVGHYTQNNYDIASIALSNNLKPEKVWHGSIGEESRLLPWVSQKIDFYGKYYYDLLTEIIEGTSSVSADSIYRSVYGSYYADSLATLSSQKQTDILTEYQYSNNLLETHYGNSGRGYAYGLEYFLRYDPYDFWNGWISITASRSMRQSNKGWRWYNSSLDRPLMFSLVNYYRLPRSYEISVKYRYMSGLPYTSEVQDSNGTRIGTTNDSRYTAYQRLDFKFSKGFTIKDSKAHFYIEAWNVFNTPNFALIDSKTKRIISFDANWPMPMLFCGFDYQW